MRVFSFADRVCYGPDMEGGADEAPLEGDVGGGDTGGGDSGDIQSDAGESNEPPQKLSVRDQIKKSFQEANEPEKPKKERGSRVGDRKAALQEATAPVTPETPAAPALPAPERLSKEAKAEWEKAPRAVQEAFIKAEQDMQKGVDELKGRYTLIDKALAPHADAMRQMNASPGEAVDRMFLWFKALANNPVQAFPGLVSSMGMDWGKLLAAVQGQRAPSQAQAGAQQPGQQPAQQGAPPIHPEVQTYIGGLENQVRELRQMVNQVQSGFGSIQNDLTAQNEAKTQENLNIWSKDKKYFNEVRQDMARLIQADPALVKNGQVDLDTAYERAIYYNPEVRARVLAEQQTANQQVQQEAATAATTAKQNQVARARKASVSLSSATTPTNGAVPVTKKPTGKQSIKDSIMAAIAEHRD